MTENCFALSQAESYDARIFFFFNKEILPEHSSIVACLGCVCYFLFSDPKRELTTFPDPNENKKFWKNWNGRFQFIVHTFSSSRWNTYNMLLPVRCYAPLENMWTVFYFLCFITAQIFPIQYLIKPSKNHGITFDCIARRQLRGG